MDIQFLACLGVATQFPVIPKHFDFPLSNLAEKERPQYYRFRTYE